ncbi:putative PEP-binding protein [Candidatus Poriferisodalis sp.]|uniref:putative PEP-binding protein n=1 Tax=Candidatus Poriferisodalis sp. TaxID=3101277 RepID=UPI003B0164F7
MAMANSGHRLSVRQQRVVAELSFDELTAALHPTFAGDAGVVLTTGLAASPGAASGVVAVGSQAALDLASAGNTVILVATETTPADVAAMGLSAGILTARGGMASHAAVVARGWGIPAVCDAREIKVGAESFAVGEHRIANGTPISIDGSTGEVTLGSREVSAAGPDAAPGGAAAPGAGAGPTLPVLPAEIAEVLGWADLVVGDRFAVLANADSAADAATARSLGARGIGLCRTEHMFLDPDRLGIVQHVILKGHDEHLDDLESAQRNDFSEMLEAMDGLGVTIRLLDAPMHEFLAGADPGEAAEWHEHNPMLGVRGVRLGLLRPELYAAQVRAIAGAVRDRRSAGGDPDVEIMVPLVSTARELTASVSAIRSAWAGTQSGSAPPIGTMIETPRACMIAGQFAPDVEFISFGTNDLTQMVFGFSRDDTATRVIVPYVSDGLLEADPFASLDPDGVGEMMSGALGRGRAANPNLRAGMCGEHGGDPASIAFAVHTGLHYVSCSPYRVPVARLAAAQALLAASG